MGGLDYQLSLLAGISLGSLVSYRCGPEWSSFEARLTAVVARSEAWFDSDVFDTAYQLGPWPT